MKYKDFPRKFWSDLDQAILSAGANNHDLLAAFDADGTLWDIDLGETYFQYLIDFKKVELPDNPWQYYLELKQKNNDPRSAYLWLAQILKNVPLTQAQEWANQAFLSIQPEPIFPEQKKLIQYLLKHNVRICIVTASVKWAVEPGARFLGLSNEDVIGVQTKIENGLITDKQEGLITYKEGKSESILIRFGKNPFFSCGNTLGDEYLLKSATHLQLGVSAASRDDKLFHAENELLDLCQKNNWPHHRFI